MKDCTIPLLARHSMPLPFTPVLATSFVTSYTSTAFTFYMRCIILYSASQRHSAWDIHSGIGFSLSEIRYRSEQK
jgi:hypothetical protein